MTTLVGKKKNFDDVVIDLLELEYDVIGGYKLAVEKMFHSEYKDKMYDFLVDHKLHVDEIKEFYSDKRSDLPDSGDLIKGLLTRMKISISDITGSDVNLLRAMLDSEDDTSQAYQRILNHPGLSDSERCVFDKAYKAEKQHKGWLEATISEVVSDEVKH
ncbi:MAG: hypothetical protein K0R14_658 [Burkholderiales bacterium]|jgi:hypothetical protein|nr:hypothetical protein [Burkholderiales bacterium]